MGHLLYIGEYLLLLLFVYQLKKTIVNKKTLIVFTVVRIFKEVSEVIRAVKPTGEIGDNCP